MGAECDAIIASHSGTTECSGLLLLLKNADKERQSKSKKYKISLKKDIYEHRYILG